MNEIMKRKIVFLTGAGISEESGIQTFRGNGGVWNDMKVEEISDIKAWMDKSKRQTMLDFYNKRRYELIDTLPNDAHIGIAGLEDKFDVYIITQNVSDLQERAGSKNVLHLHGELRKACSSNNKKLTVDYPEDGIKIGDKHQDGSQLRPFIVWFGEDVERIQEARDIVADADVFVIIGTSLEVTPASGLLYHTNTSAKIYYIDPVNTITDKGVNIIKEKATVGVDKLIKIINQQI